MRADWLMLAVLLGIMATLAMAQDAPRAFQGVFADQRVRVDLTSQDGLNYSGTITTGELKMPATARVANGVLQGTFDTSGQKFEFRATSAADGMVLETGGARYDLKKEQPAVANPLAKPAPANPLAGVGGGAPPAAGAKDPLAYHVLELPGGSIAKFDNWVYAPPQGAGGILWVDSYPQGRQNDFVMRAAVGTPNAQDMANFFTAGPQLVQQALAQFFGPIFQPVGQPQKTLCGGDEAMIENYQGSIAGRKLTCRVMYVKRKDVAIAVMGIGTDETMKEFGRAIEIVAQSISFKESSVEPGLLGTWVKESFSSAGGGGAGEKINVSSARSITLYPNGTFTDSARTGVSGPSVGGLTEGGSRGTVVKRGNSLTFHYDDGKTWTAVYELFSNGLKLDGDVYLKQ